MASTATAPNGSNTAMTRENKPMTYIPFGAKSPITLTLGIVRSLVSAKTASGKVASDDDCMKFMMLCQARTLNPFEGDAFLVGYDTKDGAKFTLITAHQAFLKRAEVHPEYDGMESGVIVKTADGSMADREGDFVFEDDIILGAWAIVHFKNRKYPMKKRLALRAFIKSYGRWKEDPAGMIVKCAEADALRSSFPTLLGGLYCEEEMPIPIEPVSVKTEPEPLKAGRTQVGGTRQKPTATIIEPPVAPVEELPPQNTTFADGGEIPNDELPPLSPDGEDRLNEITEDIERTSSVARIGTIKTKIQASIPLLGEVRVARLMEMVQEKQAALVGSK